MKISSNSCRPTSRSSQSTNGRENGGGMQVGIADDQARDFDFEKTEMKYDSTGMFHWSPARPIDECILVRSDKRHRWGWETAFVLYILKGHRSTIVECLWLHQRSLYSRDIAISNVIIVRNGKGSTRKVSSGGGCRKRQFLSIFHTEFWIKEDPLTDQISFYQYKFTHKKEMVTIYLRAFLHKCNAHVRWDVETLIYHSTVLVVGSLAANSWSIDPNEDSVTVSVLFEITGPKSGRNDRSQWPRGGVLIRWPGLTVDRPEKPGDATQSFQLPLPRAEARRHRRFCGLHKARVENAAKPSENLHSKRKQNVQPRSCRWRTEFREGLSQRKWPSVCS